MHKPILNIIFLVKEVHKNTQRELFKCKLTRKLKPILSSRKTCFFFKSFTPFEIIPPHAI
jgi:hypothetical protein